MLGCHMSAATQRLMHHQKSSSDSPLHANTAVPEGTQQRATMKNRVELKEQKSLALMTFLHQSGSNSILGGKDVAGGPATPSSEC